MTDDSALPSKATARTPRVSVDARGLRCPLPVIRLAQAALGQPAGTVLQMVVTDPAAVYDVPAWARMRGHTWLDPQEESPGEFTLRVRLEGPPAEPRGS